jgi:hypothetical protein
VLLDKQITVLLTSATLWAMIKYMLYVGLNLIGNSFKCRALVQSDNLLTRKGIAQSTLKAMCSHCRILQGRVAAGIRLTSTL